MFNFHPYYSGYPSYGPYYPATPNSEYRRALAEERAAHEQYAAARRAQEEAKQRAARARAARSVYGSPYNSYLADDDDDVNDDPLGEASYPQQTPFGYAASPYGLDTSPALMEERRRRQLLEKERRQLEEARIRRMVEEERRREEAERAKAAEEERVRRALEQERLRRQEDEEDHMPGHLPQNDLDPLLRALGFMRPNGVDANEASRAGRPSARSSTHPPTTRRAAGSPSSSPPRAHPFHTRTPSAPPAQRNPSEPITIPISSTATPPSPSPVTPPPSSPSPTPIESPTPEQNSAAEKIQTAYRARVARRAALKSVSELRKRFIALHCAFSLPTTLDYATTSNPHEHVTISVDPALAVEQEQEQGPVAIPKLAYTPANTPVHAYEEELNRLLNALDGVESGGDIGVRAARKELVRIVEREAEHLERWKVAAWRAWVRKQAAPLDAPPAPTSQEEAPVMEVEPTQAIPPSPLAAEDDLEDVERSSTPSLGHPDSEDEMEVELELDEARTPPPTETALPVVVEAPESESAPSPVPVIVSEQGPKTRPAANSLFDWTWEDLDECDLF